METGPTLIVRPEEPAKSVSKWFSYSPATAQIVTAMPASLPSQQGDVISIHQTFYYLHATLIACKITTITRILRPFGKRSYSALFHPFVRYSWADWSHRSYIATATKFHWLIANLNRPEFICQVHWLIAKARRTLHFLLDKGSSNTCNVSGFHLWDATRAMCSIKSSTRLL